MQLSLEQLIRALELLPPHQNVVRGFGNAHSYRGYYESLAFEPVSNTTVGAMLEEAKEANGKTFGGYKGGDFKMGPFTDCYIAYYGDMGYELSDLLLHYLIFDPRPWPPQDEY